MTAETREAITLTAGATVTIRITTDAPEDVFTRGEDPEWMDDFYGNMDRGEVLDHWVWNALTNGVEDVSRLDGWADVPKGAVTFDAVGTWIMDGKP